MAWDYGVMEAEDLNSVVSMAGKLGLSGVCILADADFKAPKGRVSVARGLLIDERNPETMRKSVMNNRKSFEVIAVMGMYEKVNRAAAETAGVDMLIPSHDTKVDVVMAKEAKKRNVRIAFDFSALLHSSLEDRGEAFSQMMKNAQSVRKCRAPFLIISGAKSAYGMRSQSELTAFGKVLGFDEASVKASMGSALIDENRKRLSGRWVMPGVEVEE
jgi:RNase P/RNase MRP subunit p30